MKKNLPSSYRCAGGHRARSHSRSSRRDPARTSPSTSTGLKRSHSPSAVVRGCESKRAGGHRAPSRSRSSRRDPARTSPSTSTGLKRSHSPCAVVRGPESKRASADRASSRSRSPGRSGSQKASPSKRASSSYSDWKSLCGSGPVGGSVDKESLDEIVAEHIYPIVTVVTQTAPVCRKIDSAYSESNTDPPEDNAVSNPPKEGNNSHVQIFDEDNIGWNSDSNPESVKNGQKKTSKKTFPDFKPTIFPTRTRGETKAKAPETRLKPFSASPNDIDDDTTSVISISDDDDYIPNLEAAKPLKKTPAATYKRKKILRSAGSSSNSACKATFATIKEAALPQINKKELSTETLSEPARTFILNQERALLLKDHGRLLDHVLLKCPRNNVDTIKRILDDVLQVDTNVNRENVAGLGAAKKKLEELLLWPLLNPSNFKGVRAPGKGVLLFGPPGTGKSLIGKWLATEAKSIFFNVTASTLLSKWMGESEKLVKTLFEVARVLQPSIIFIDEIDSLLSQRGGEKEHESSRRIKTQLLIAMEGCSTNDEDKVVVIGATTHIENRYL